MRKNKTLLLAILFFQISIYVFGQDNEIKIPTFKDKYSNYVQQLENGDLYIDYVDFRNSFLDSEQFSKKGTNYDNLKKQVYADIKNKDYQGVINSAKAMLSIDYTSLFAHKYLQQTYKILGDTINQKKYHDIEFGLLYSIIRSGDGKTCETGWHVTQVEEEYFILNMIGADLSRQSLDSEGNNSCDKMVVNMENGKTETYYFEINKVLAQEQKMFTK